MIVVGGGATGAGVAVDAACRGYECCCWSSTISAKAPRAAAPSWSTAAYATWNRATSRSSWRPSRSAACCSQNAPHLVRNLGFVVPKYDWWEAPFYGVGLKLYNLLAGKYGFGTSRILSRGETLERLPTIKTEGLRGGVIYFDGQFDDARLLINLVATAAEQGATLLNYAPVTAVTRTTRASSTACASATWRPARSRRRAPRSSSTPPARSPTNCAAAADPCRRAHDRALARHTPGVRRRFPGRRERHHGPAYQRRARDVRHPVARAHRGGHHRHARSPRPASSPSPWSRKWSSSCRPRRCTSTASPSRADVRSIFAGIRPLVRSGEAGNTAALSRDHTIRIENSGMVTICGGKWTTYRHMAEDCVNQAATLARLPEKPCLTAHLNIHGFHPASEKYGRLWVYGSDARMVQELERSQRGLGGTARSGTALHSRRSDLGGTPRIGGHGGRYSGAAHARALPQCRRRPAHGAARGTT